MASTLSCYVWVQSGLLVVFSRQLSVFTPLPTDAIRKYKDLHPNGRLFDLLATGVSDHRHGMLQARGFEPNAVLDSRDFLHSS